MPQKLLEPKVITDFNNDPVCILPRGFLLTDERWELIWSLHERCNRFINHEELRALFPEEDSLVSSEGSESLNKLKD